MAPTPHNTQPYRIRPTSETEAELVLECDRLLPDEDHGNLYVLSTSGVFMAAIERAGRALGLAVRTCARESLDGARLHRTSGRVVVGSAVIEGEASKVPADLLATRRTSRLPYHDRLVEPSALERFERVVRTAGHHWVETSDPAVVRDVLWTNVEAIIDNLQITRERREIRRWYRYGRTPRHGDGLWQTPMNQPAWQIRAGLWAPWLFAHDPLRSMTISRYVATQSGTRHIALICGGFSAWSELVAAGHLLMDLWLEMAEANVYMHPLGSLLTNPRYAAWVAKAFGRDDTWLIVRLGYSDPPPPSPRLASIVIQ